MLLDRRRVKFWQRWVFLVMAVLMGSWLISIPIGRAAGCGSTTSASNSLEQEIQSLQTQVKADPKNAAAWNSLAQALQSRANTAGRSTDAQTADFLAAAAAYQKYDKLLAKEKGSEAKAERLATLEMLGRIYSDLGEYAQAVQVYGQLTDLKPKNADYFFNLGSAAQSAGDTNAALLAYTKFLQLAPDSPIAAQVKQWVKDNTPKGSTP